MRHKIRFAIAGLLLCLVTGSVTTFAQDSTASKEPEDQIFMVVDDIPQFHDGGLNGLSQFLSQTIVYPIEARKKNIQGTVYVSFVVEKNGDISAVQTVKGVDTLLDEEAMRVVKLTKWIPGKQKGKLVRTRFVLPINFKLENAKRKK